LEESLVPSDSVKDSGRAMLLWFCDVPLVRVRGQGLTRGATTNMLSRRIARTVAVIATNAYLFSPKKRNTDMT